VRQARLLGLAFLASCSTYSNRGVRPLRPLELATAPYTETVAAELTGSLMYEGGCLLFREDGTEDRLLPVWPTGSIFNGTSVIFHEPGKADQPILIAQEFVMAGRSVAWPALSQTTYAPFEHQCTARPFLVSKIWPAN
jgi:hypothetical protein